jgi:DHA1 family bicyclomycin/chloramphenicol resistance-like MFS transporter
MMNQASPNKGLILLILGALTTVSPLSIDMYLPAFDQIAEDFGTTQARVSLSVASYFIGLAIGQMLYGPLLDRFGRKRPLYVGLIIYMIATIGCIQSQSTEFLIVLRFIQALGGCVAWVGAMTMVRDFFPIEESSKVFSLLVLILGVSPLLAPTFGGFIAVALGWQWIFIVLCIIGFLILLLVYFYLPEGHPADPTISLKAGPMLATFVSILKNPQFFTYTFSGAFAFASLFIYVAGSPMIFMEMYHISPQAYGGIFALLSVGFIGGSQLNIFLVRKYSSNRIFKTALITQFTANVVFLILAGVGVLELYSTIGMFFIVLTCIGLINPNASALALAPFSRNVGSASALLGCTQIGVAALASSGVGLFDSGTMTPVVIMLSGTSLIAFLILMTGLKKLGGNIITGSSLPEGIAH